MIPRSTPQHSHTREVHTAKDSLATDRRAVFDWYEDNRYRHDAGEIFSSEWRCRLTDWRKEFDPDTQNVHDKMRELENDPEALELGLFFAAHSIAAFSFWHLLQACYELDKRICETSVSSSKASAAWQKLRPFEYLLSTNIGSEWGANLDSLSTQIEPNNNIFTQAIAANRLLAIFHGVRMLEEALAILTSVFTGKQKDMSCSFWVLGFIREGVSNRFRTIENHITHH